MTIESALPAAAQPTAAHPPTTWREEARRIAAGVGLAAIYGVALGLRDGGPSLAQHALGAPLGILGVLLLAVPSLYIGLAIFDAPVRPIGMAHAAARGVATTGLVLGGLGPAAGLFVVTTESEAAAAIIAGLGLGVAALLGLRTFFRTIAPVFEEADHATSTMATLLGTAFALIAALVAGRIWWTMLPVIGGAS